MVHPSPICQHRIVFVSVCPAVLHTWTPRRCQQLITERGEEEKQVFPPLKMSCVSFLSVRVCLITMLSPRFTAVAVALGSSVVQTTLAD